MRHAVTEALRVYEFLKVCQEASPTSGKDLGKILLASHDSLRTDYDCSTASLNRLVQLCLDCGGYGARITGAGWGGCIVSLVPSGKVNGYLERLRNDYYRPLVEKGTVKQEDVDDAIVISEPECGACLWQDSRRR